MKHTANSPTLNPRAARLFFACAFLLLASLSSAAEPARFTAQAGLALARDAARVWAADAALVYVENDEPLAADGTAERWGYLFHSAATGQSRGYSLRRGEVVEAANLEFDLTAPPLPEHWLDSTAILAAAEREAGGEYRAAHEGQLATMFLIRGAFHEQEPDRSTWTVVYTAAGAPSLLVVVDAARGKVIRKWRG